MKNASQPPERNNMQPHELEQARKMALLAKVKTVRDAILVNRGAIRGPDTMEYRWVNQKDERQLSFQSLGWKKVTAEDTEVETQYRQPDGTHVRGDLVLYQIDKEFAEALHLYDVLKGTEMIEGHKSAFRTAANRVGAPTFEPQIA